MDRAHRDQDGVFERREIAALAELEFLLEITGEIVMPRKLNRWGKGSVSLHKHFAGRFASSGASSHLSQKLEGSLTRPKIRQMQSEIGVNDSDERHIREVQAFRDHLRADQDVDLACSEIS